MKVNKRCHGNLSHGIVYKYKENVCDFVVSQAYVKGREATPFTSNAEILAFSYAHKLHRSMCYRNRLLINKFNARGSG